MAAGHAEFRLMAAKLTFATIPANARDSCSDFIVFIFMIPFAPRAFTRFNATTRSSDFSANITQVSLPSLRVTRLPRINRDLLE